MLKYKIMIFYTILSFKEKHQIFFQGFLFTDYDMNIDTFMALALKPLHYV